MEQIELEYPQTVEAVHTHTPSIQLINGDCLKALKDIPDASIDLVVTDCPYHIVSGGCSKGAYGNGNGIFTKNHEPSRIFNRRRIAYKKSGGYILEGTKHIALGGVLDDNDSTTYARQGKLFKHNDIKFCEWLPEIYRVLKNGTHAYIYINARNIKDLQTEAEKVGSQYQQLIVWDKGNATPNRYYLNVYELVLMLRKGKARNINNMGDKNIIRIKNILGGKKTHPTEKPVELNKVFVINSSNEEETVLDPFMGSGSCGVACKETGRNFIGIEIDKKYFNIAKERIDQA